jgi:hypothetical protein
MRRSFLCLLLSLLLLQAGLVAYAQYQPMGIRIGSYSLAANGATNVPAFCLKQGAKSPEPGVNYNSIGYGGRNAYLVTSQRRYTIREALEQGIVSITGADDFVSYDKLVFQNNTNEAIRFEVTDDFVIKTADDSYEHIDGILNTGGGQEQVWETLRRIDDEDRLLREVNATTSNRLLTVSYENTGTAIKYTIRNGQDKPVYSGNNFREIARLTNSGSSQKQYFLLKDFPTSDREAAFLSSVTAANQNVPGYKAARLVNNNLEFSKQLMQENPTLLNVGTMVESESIWFQYEVSADVEINHVEYEVIVEADKESLLTTWKNRIRTLFGIRSNNLNDILTGANRTIRHVFPDDDYMVFVDDYSISFVIKVKKADNVLIARK